MKNIKIGYAYGFIHMLVEIICFQILYTYFNSLIGTWLIALLFDFFAFVPQFIIGSIADKYKKLNIGKFGTFLLLTSSLIFYLYNLRLIAIIILGLGNALIHEAGAIATTTVSNGKLSHSAIFVSGGSFGVIIGQVLGTYLTNKENLIISIICIIIINILIVATNKYWIKNDRIIPEFKITKENIKSSLVIFIAFFIVVSRSFIGYAIPISWKKELWQAFLLFFIMGLGKALGGILSDKFGAKTIGIVSTLLSIPFLLIGSNEMILSIIGVFLFSFNMSITFGMLLSIFKQNPGIAFGITTIGLFVGLFPVFIFGLFPSIVNSILIIILSLLSAIGMHKILK